MVYLNADELAARALPMEPTQVRDAFVRAAIDGEGDAPLNASGYSTVRHGLARAIPLVLAEERARVLELVCATFAPPGAELPPDVTDLIKRIAGGDRAEGVHTDG